ncbi:MAG: PilZ domain-containing protein [Thermodesulfovibrionales bacterium]|nr:PilZ domain-containing protein [Thermodesulfovibrionales bacterium]
MFEQRQFERKSFDETFYCAVTVLDVIDTKILNLVARGIDISDGGIGIKTDYPLEPGHVMRLHDGITKVGVVRWSRNGESNGIYRVGVKFV